MKDLSNFPASPNGSIPLSVKINLAGIVTLLPLIAELQWSEPDDAVGISLLEFKIAYELLENVPWYKYPAKLKKKELFGLMQCYMGHPYCDKDYDIVA